MRTVRTSSSATPSAARLRRTSDPSSGSPASSGNRHVRNLNHDRRLLSGARRQRGRQHAASPRPMQVVATARRVHVQRLADHVRARHGRDLRTVRSIHRPHRSRPPRRTWHCRGVAEPRSRSSASPSAPARDGASSRFADGARPRRATGRFQHAIGPPPAAPCRAARRRPSRSSAPERGAIGAPAAPVEDRRLHSHGESRLESTASTSPGSARLVRLNSRDTRHAVLAEHHLAHLAGCLGIALVGAIG